jgi:hypothetical protein
MRECLIWREADGCGDDDLDVGMAVESMGAEGKAFLYHTDFHQT